MSPSTTDPSISVNDSLGLIQTISDCFPDYTKNMIEENYLESIALCMNIRAFPFEESNVVFKATECCYKAVSSITENDHFVILFENETIMKAIKRLADPRGFKKAHKDAMDKSRIPIPDEIAELAKSTLKILTSGLEKRSDELEKLHLATKENIAPEVEKEPEIPEIAPAKTKNPNKILKDTRRQSRIFKAGGRNIKKHEKKDELSEKLEKVTIEEETTPKMPPPSVIPKTVTTKVTKKSASASFIIDGLTSETSNECEEAFLTLRGKGIISLHINVKKSIAVLRYKEDKLSIKDLAYALRNNSSLKVQGTLVSLVKDGKTQMKIVNGKQVSQQKYLDYFYSDEENQTTEQEGFLDSEELHFDILENDENGQLANDRPWRFGRDFFDTIQDMWQRNFYW